jgi:uncharacterized membrane protein YqjE
MSVPSSQTPQAHPNENQSVGELVGRMTSDLSHLMRDEIELAKVEVKDEVINASKAAGLLGGSGVVALFALLMLSFAAAWGLAEVMATGFAFLIMGTLYVGVAAVMLVLGRQRWAAVNPVPEQTVGTLKEDVAWVKEQKS